MGAECGWIDRQGKEFGFDPPTPGGRLRCRGTTALRGNIRRGWVGRGPVRPRNDRLESCGAEWKGMGADMAEHGGHVSLFFLLISACNSVHQLPRRRSGATATLGILLGNSSSLLQTAAIIGQGELTYSIDRCRILGPPTENVRNGRRASQEMFGPNQPPTEFGLNLFRLPEVPSPNGFHGPPKLHQGKYEARL